MSVVRAVLNDIEWNKGFTIPVANHENQELEHDVVNMEKEFDQTKKDVASTEDRVNAMKDHLKNVQREQVSCQSLMNARKHELDTEGHLAKIADREVGRLKQELSRYKGEIEDIHDKKNRQQNRIFKLQNEMDEMKNELQYDQGGLEAWLEESAKRDEDLMTLEKYSKADEGKIKELTLKLERYTRDREKAHRALEQEQTNTKMMQVELDRIAEEFRRAHKERQRMIGQWEKTIKRMQQRDREMEKLAIELRRAKSDLGDRSDVVRNKSQQLDEQQLENEQIHAKIQSADKQAARLATEAREAEIAKDIFRSELQALKRTVDKTANELEQNRAAIQHMKRDAANQQENLAAAKRQREVLEKRMKMAQDDQITAEEIANEMDELLKYEEKRQAVLDSELKKLREIEFKRAQDLAATKDSVKSQEAFNQGGHATAKNLQDRITKLDAETLKQQEIIYNQDFTLHQLEHRLARVRGETQSTDEKQKLEERIAELEAVLNDRKETSSLLTSQLKFLVDDVRRTQREHDQFEKKSKDMTETIDQLELLNSTTQKQLKKSTEEKNELLVEQNVLKLEVKKLQTYLAGRTGEVMSLEKRKLELQSAVRERRNEIKLHQDMLTQQVKGCEEERLQVSTELREKISRVEKLKRRFDILTISMAPPDGDEEKSQAYYVIKAAQEKDELQRKGDDLDSKIRKAEKEIRAMENTLKVVNSRNEQYRQALQKVPEGSEVVEEMEEAEAQLKSVKEKLRNKKRYLNELLEDIETMKTTMDELTGNESVHSEALKTKNDRLSLLQNDVKEQVLKVDRAKKLIQKLRKDTGDPKYKTDLADIYLREVRDSLKKCLRSLADMVGEHPEFAQAINMELAKVNLTLPSQSIVGGHGSVTGRTTTFSARSIGSDTSQNASARITPKTVEIGFNVVGSPSPSSQSRAMGPATPSSGRSLGSERSSARSTQRKTPTPKPK